MPEQNAPGVPLRSDEFIEEALHRWGDTVLRLALNQMGNAADAEDVFQDVFVRLLKDGTAFNDDEHLKAWLLRVTINRCNDVRKAGWRRRNEPLDERCATIEAPNLFSSDVWEAVGELPPDLRTVIHLFYVEGYSTDEIANLVDCRPSTARTRLHRARASLKNALGASSDAEKEAEHDGRSAQGLRIKDAGREGFGLAAR